MRSRSAEQTGYSFNGTSCGAQTAGSSYDGLDLTVGELADMGVRRIGVGGGLAQIAWDALLSAARAMQTISFGGLYCETSDSELNDRFGKFL